MEDILHDRLKKLLLEPTDGAPSTLHEKSNVIESHQGALIALIGEATRRDWSKEDLKAYLAGFTEREITECINVTDCLQETRPSEAAKLIKFQWRLQHEIYNSEQGKVSKAKCLLRFTLSNGTSCLIGCTERELAHLSLRLRDLCNNIRRQREGGQQHYC